MTVPLTNTGARSGSTVVQCYVEPPAAGPSRPARELRGFSKVTLPAGESGVATVALTKRDFSIWDTDAHDWTVPAGEYRIVVGLSSRELDHAGTVTAD